MNCPICDGELYPTYYDPTFTSCKQCRERFTIDRKRYKKGSHWVSVGEGEWKWQDENILVIRRKTE